MAWLILTMILIAAYNATAAAMEWRSQRWFVPVYWLLVGVYWMIKATDIGGV